MVNQRKVILATILIVIGLMGVGVIQSLWLRMALENKKNEFDHKVYESLDAISKSIEDLEHKPFMTELLIQIRQQRQSLDPIKVLPEGKKKEDVLMDSSLSDLKYISEEELNQALNEQLEEFQQMMMKEMISTRPIQEIIDTSSLNGLIKDILSSKGLKTEFQYGITEYADNNFVLLSDGADLISLYRTQYSIKLFPQSVIDGNKFLKLHFPDQGDYLLASFAWPILSSIVFFIMILTSFFLIFKVIFQQKKLSDMKTDFINNMTHELKTPIATISLASEMLRDKTISSKEENRLKYAGIIYEENKRLANHVEQVLQLARLEKGEIQLNLVNTDIHEVIRNVIHQFTLICEEEEGTIQTDFQASPSYLMADEMHLTNAIKNLVDNAFKYNDKKPVITIRTRNAEKGIMVYVKDNGIGLSRENQTRIFEKFYRVQKGNVHDTKGFGLGLNYVKSIVEAHQGTITVDSKLKEGTTFVMYLPYQS